MTRDGGETEHRNAPNLENVKTLCSLAFSGLSGSEYRAGFLSRVSQVRILPRAPTSVFFCTRIPDLSIDVYFRLAP